MAPTRRRRRSNCLWVIEKAAAHEKGAKIVKPAAGGAGALQNVTFSDLNAPPVGAAPASKIDFPSGSKGAPKDPSGKVSLGLKWRATNNAPNPFDAMRHTSGPDGPGDAVEAGVKLGF
jgi:hypothetical protein